MVLLLGKSLRVDTRELDTDTLAGIDSQVEIFLNLIDIEILLSV